GFCTALFFVAMQLIFGLDFSYYSSLNGNTFNPDSGTIRYPGVFHDSQKHGQFLALFSFALLIPNDFWKFKGPWGNRLLFLFTSLAILLTGSRSALAGFILGCAVLFILGGPRIRAFFMAMAGMGALVLLIYAPQMTIFERSANISEDYLFRKAIWEETIDIAGDHPFLGIGLGNFEKYVTVYNQDLYLQNGEGDIIYLDQPENGYLKLLVEHGYVGMVLFIMIVLVPLIRGLTTMNKASKTYYLAFLVSGVLSWVLAFNTVYSLTDNRLLVLLCTYLVLLYFAGSDAVPIRKWGNKPRNNWGNAIGNA
ncbi:MAG: O-antigen ligase family protein, partial [Flavobacteriaceae bacterium]